MLSRNASLEVKNRLQHALFWLLESGQFAKFDTDPVPQFENTPNVNKEQLIYCLTNMGKKEKIQPQEIMIRLSFILFFTQAWSIGLAIALICYVAEKIIHLDIIPLNKSQSFERKKTFEDHGHSFRSCLWKTI